MRDVIVGFLISLAQSHPYLLLACVVIGSIWLARSLLHKARLFTRTLVKEFQETKTELREWRNDLSELKRELATWKSSP